MSPILVRPVREQLEHDRVIRLLQVRLKRKHDVVTNIGEDQTVPVRIGQVQIFPDLVLTSADRGKKLMGTVEVETAESVNHLEAMAQWAHLGRARAPFHLYVPAGCVDIARRLAAENQRQRRRNLELPHDRRPDPIHARAPRARSEIRRLRNPTGRRPAAAATAGRRLQSRVASRRPPGGRRPPRRRRPKPRDQALGRSQGRLQPDAEKEVALPTLRFTRDKRGYENTYVVHSPRRRHAGAPRILYWFRTPPGRPGRAGRPGRGRDPADRRAQPADPLRLAADSERARTSLPPPEAGPDEAESTPNEPSRHPRRGPASAAGPATGARAADAEPPEVEPLSPAHARLGSEGLARLRARYADVAASISPAGPGRGRRQQLNEQAERLNPDSWVTDDEVQPRPRRVREPCSPRSGTWSGAGAGATVTVRGPGAGKRRPEQAVSSEEARASREPHRTMSDTAESRRDLRPGSARRSDSAAGL